MKNIQFLRSACFINWELKKNKIEFLWRLKNVYLNNLKKVEIQWQRPAKKSRGFLKFIFFLVDYFFFNLIFS